MFVILGLVIGCLAASGSGDRPCLPRQYPGQSVVCVCNATYCDEITRDTPRSNSYVTYTSSAAGSRFVKATRPLQTSLFNFGNRDVTLSLDTNTKYQTVEGFGGAVTDAAGINWNSLGDSSLKQYFIDSYFSKCGIQYNMLRVPIGGSDFSTHPYAYNEEPEDDAGLTNFALAHEDFTLKIPMIKSIMKASEEQIHVVATCWSPPRWMKSENRWGGISELKPEFYQTYADYHLEFLKHYAKQGIPVWGITTTNEPINGMIDFATFNSLGWSPLKQGAWIAKNLGPTIRNSSFADVKILAGDDQRASIPWWFILMVSMNPEALQYVDGVAVHWYTDLTIPPSILNLITDYHPDKFILSTEACEGAMPWDKEKVLLGSWDRAKSYIFDILDDLNHNVVGWIDWNLCLDSEGGPNWVQNYVDSPVIVFPENKEFVKQPMFYAMGHFSKFLPRGSRRIKVTSNKPTAVEHVAFETTRDTVVVVLYNDGGPTKLSLQLGRRVAPVSLEANSVVTVEIPLRCR